MVLLLGIYNLHCTAVSLENSTSGIAVLMSVHFFNFIFFGVLYITAKLAPDAVASCVCRKRLLYCKCQDGYPCCAATVTLPKFSRHDQDRR